MLVIYRVGGVVFVRIKLGIWVWSWRRGPGNVRIDVSTRTSIFGFCGGEHILDDFSDIGVGCCELEEKKKRRGSDDSSEVVASDTDNAVRAAQPPVIVEDNMRIDGHEAQV